MPKISIVMPVYNGEQYLREAIDSVIAQTFTDWEFIIVSEYGSNDAATVILNEYAKKDTRIQVIYNTERLRIAESLNVGLRAATGEYIARMDGDDICGEKRLERQLAFMESHPDVDVCGIEVSLFGDSVWDWKMYCGAEYLRGACLFYTPFVHPTIMMRTASLRKYRLEYDRRFTYTEDFDFFVRASKFLKFENIIDKSLYHYRFTAGNATNVGGDRGLIFQREVMERTFKEYGVEFTSEEILTLSPNTNQGLDCADKALCHLEELDLLLKKVFLSKKLQQEFGLFVLFQVLHRRWMDAYEQVRWKPNIMEDGRVQRAIDRGLFHYAHFWDGTKVKVVSETPMVTILVPTYNSEDYIMDTVYSLLDQDFTDFEFLVVNELGSDDKTVECVSLFRDPRIRILQNEERLGLAESLNFGIREAKGKYIARADADDVYPRDRLSKQVRYMEKHPEIGVCGSWQRHFGQRNYIHTPPASPEDMKASLLFKCEVCHSTLLLRREAFIQNELWYDNTYLSEDYELWCRASTKMGFATIPEVLGEYRWNGDNITAQKMDRLDIEAQKLVARNLKDHLGMEIEEKDLILLSGWKNPFYDSNPDYLQLREREERLLDAIALRNKKVKAYSAEALKKVLDQRRAWAFIGNVQSVENNILCDAPKKVTFKHRIKVLLKRFLKPFYQPFRWRYEDRLTRIENAAWQQHGMLTDMQKTIYDSDGHLYDYYNKLQQHAVQIDQMLDARMREVEKLMNQVMDARIREAEKLINQTMDTRVWEAEKRINQTMDTRVWEAEKRINQTMDTRVWENEKTINQVTDARIWRSENLLIQTMQKKIDSIKNATAADLYQRNRVPYYPGEKIRIVFLYQVASFWPSWDMFYRQLVADDRFDVKFLFLDETVWEESQMLTAEAFLKEQGIPYIPYGEFDLDSFAPHIIVMQTPYDEGHRKDSHHAFVYKSKGYRVVYIPYGIEITDTETSRRDHFESMVVRCAWRVYTFSKEILSDYRKHCENASAVRGLGVPRFDGLWNKNEFQLSEEIRNRIGDRKVVLWKVHFPKTVFENDREIFITPDLDEYVKFSEMIRNYPEYFFIFLPHPKFKNVSGCREIEMRVKKIFENLEQADNVWIDFADDYRHSLVSADYIITDRSAVMVEAGLMQVPILYMQNPTYQEKMTQAVEPLVSSYYSGCKADDMTDFLEMCKEGKDPQKEERMGKARECLYTYDGHCTERIIDDLIRGLESEAE